ncbi:hypothetical protein [Micromonospora sp. KC606]|uniref:hypothetical protein n=1 Tax=Micromonospora sp. KC606 TaxID=2530379 RepID=UPI0014051120|nr:hypothetical protein [Micromonospora sp. KC606]
MVDLWRRYGHPLRLALVACAVVYAGATGAGLLTDLAAYRLPSTQVALCAGCAVLYVAVAWRTRAPSPAPTGMLVVLLVANVLSAVDPRVGRGATAWAPNLIGAALTLVAFTAPVRRTLVLVGASLLTNGLLITLRYAAGDPAEQSFARLLTGDVGMLTGVLPALMIMVALRDHAAREADQRRRTRAAEGARAIELAVRTDRRTLLEPALRQARAVLAGLAEGGADPTDPTVRAGCRDAERRLRAALLDAVDEAALVTLTQQLLAASDSRVELTVQGGAGWEALPPAARDGLVEVLHLLVEAPQTRRINLTVLPDDGTVWVSLTVDGGPPLAAVPPALDPPSTRGRLTDQWWLEWTMVDGERTRRLGGQDDERWGGSGGGGARRRPFHVPRGCRALARTGDRRGGAGRRHHVDGQ